MLLSLQEKSMNHEQYDFGKKKLCTKQYFPCRNRDL